MSEEKQQKFTAKCAGDWCGSIPLPPLNCQEEGGSHRSEDRRLHAAELADVESALTWIAQNKEAHGSGSD